jgi:hypothetical protein
VDRDLPATLQHAAGSRDLVTQVGGREADEVGVGEALGVQLPASRKHPPYRFCAEAAL